MKGNFILSVIAGVFFAIPTYLICLLLISEVALPMAVLSGLLFHIAMFIFLMLHEKWQNRKYAQAEKAITSPVFLKVNGNFTLEKGTRNGNIYFCEAGIVFILLDQKPHIVEELLQRHIEKYEFDQIHMNIYANDGRRFLITTADAQKVLTALRSRNWIA